MRIHFKIKYMLPALIVAIVSLAACIIVSQNTMKMFNIVVEFVQFLCALVSFIYIIICLIKRKASMIYKLIAEALGCFLLGELYWVLHIYIKGYEQLGTFSISDLSWIGFYIFLLSVDYSVLNSDIRTKSKELRKYNLLSLAAPVLVIAANTVLFLFGDDLFYTIIYTLPTSFLSFYSMKYIIIPNKTTDFIKPYRFYNSVVGLIIVFDNLTCLATKFGGSDAEYFFKFGFAMLLLLISPAVYKGVEKWSM